MEFFYTEKLIDIDVNRDTPQHHKILIKPVDGQKLRDGLIDYNQIYVSTLGCVHNIQSLLNQHNANIEVRCFTQETKSTVLAGEKFPIFLSNFNVNKLESGTQKIKSTKVTLLEDKLKPLIEKNQRDIKVALINGIGTGIGDSVIGIRAVQIFHNRLSKYFENIEIHLFQTPFNANKNKRKIYDQEKIINSVQVLPVTLEHILDFDCIADFSSMTLRDTFDTLPMIDFFLENLGIEPNTIDKKEKRNFLKVNEKIANEEKIKFLALRESKRPLLMLHTLASVHIRSMPEIVIEKLVVKLIKDTEYNILITNNLHININDLKKKFSDNDQLRIHDFAYTSEDVDTFINVISNVDSIITVDTSTYHIADAFNKPTVVFLPTIDPILRTKYYPSVSPIVLKANNKLWGKHLSLIDEERKYAWSLWNNLNLDNVLTNLKEINHKVKQETKYISCPICDYLNEYVPVDQYLENHLIYCKHCHCEFTTNRVADNYDKMYEGEYQHYIKESRNKEETIAGYMTQNRFEKVRPFLENLPTRGKFLDIGCANGFMVGYAKELKYSAFGIDASSEAIKYARENLLLGNKVEVCQDLSILPNNFPKTFDIITSFELVEHLEDPNKFASQVFERLNPGGIWIFSTPNRNRIQFAMGIKNTGMHRGLESGDYPPEHLTRFRPESHKVLCERNGFEIFYQATSRLSSDMMADKFGLFPEISVTDPDTKKVLIPNQAVLNRAMFDYFQQMTNCIDGYGNFLVTFARKIN